MPVHDFNHQLEKIVGCIVLQFIHMMKIQKMLGHKTLRCTNTATSSKEMNQGETLFSITNYLNKLCSTFVQLVYTLAALKLILLYVLGCEKRKSKHIITDQGQNRTRILFFIKLDRYLSVEMLSSSCQATRLEQLLKLDGQLAVELAVEL